MKNKLLLTTSAALLILISIALFINNNAVLDNPSRINETSELYDPGSQPSQNPEEQVSLLIDFGELGTFDYQAEYQEGQTALSLLLQAAEQRDVQVKTTEYDFGTIVDSIDGMENSSEMAWIYFVNGQSANVGADSYEVGGGDMIEWRYTEPN